MTSAFILPSSSNHFISHSLSSGDAPFINACKILSALLINSLCVPLILSILPAFPFFSAPCISFSLSFNRPISRTISPHFSRILAYSALCSTTLSSTVLCASCTALMCVVIDATCVPRNRSVSGVSINSRCDVSEDSRGTEVLRVKMAGGTNGSVSREMYAGGPAIGVSVSLATNVAGVISVDAGGAVMLGSGGSDEEEPTLCEGATRRFSGKDAIRKTEVRTRTL